MNSIKGLVHVVFGIIIFVSCSKKEEDILKYVNPFIGTGGHGHTFPGATIPFGMVQLSPDQGTTGWDWCSGYHYSDSSLLGFSHNHLSGTGGSGLGDILVTATTGEIKMIPGTKEKPDEGFRSRFSHDNEEASPGYYRVFLKDYAVDAEMTATDRVGFHRYTFTEGGKGHIIFDPTNKISGRTIESFVSIERDIIRGYSYCRDWGGGRTTYFTAKFSRPFDEFGVYTNGNKEAGKNEAKAEDARAWVSFELKEDECIEIKVAISGVSAEGADKNFDAEAKDITFDQAHAAARAKWENKLSRIIVAGGTEDQKTIFYTALYHNFIAPNLWMDVDGKYWALGQKLQANGFKNYSTFSLWDTFRATHPLFTIIDQKATADFANSLISRYYDGKGSMPLWELTGFDNRTMLGYHSSSVIWDALVKGVKGINEQKALEAMIDAAHVNKFKSSEPKCAMPSYRKYGYVPSNVIVSVSYTLEYAYNDWCVGMLAKKLGKHEEAKYYLNWSNSFENHFQKDKKRFWMKDSLGIWHDDFKLNSWESLRPHYISGNFWAYEYFVPHKMERLVELKGGKEAFENELDAMFANDTEMVGAQHVDISGFIGKYGHGDEPGHHVPYLYNYTNSPWKTQEMVDKVRSMYTNAVDGIVNNEDCGQMSAWFIFSSLGFYPVCPGKTTYDIGTPLWNEAQIKLENGNIFKIKANNASSRNIFVQSSTMNGKPLDDLFVNHEDILKGGELVFEMGPEPNKNLGRYNVE